jgi:hypothetical protein
MMSVQMLANLVVQLQLGALFCVITLIAYDVHPR